MRGSLSRAALACRMLHVGGCFDNAVKSFRAMDSSGASALRAAVRLPPIFEEEADIAAARSVSRRKFSVFPFLAPMRLRLESLLRRSTLS